MSSNVLQPNPPHRPQNQKFCWGERVRNKRCCHKYPSAATREKFPPSSSSSSSSITPHLCSLFQNNNQCFIFLNIFTPDICGLFGLCLGQSFLSFFHRENRKALKNLLTTSSSHLPSLISLSFPFFLHTLIISLLYASLFFFILFSSFSLPPLFSPLSLSLSLDSLAI